MQNDDQEPQKTPGQQPEPQQEPALREASGAEHREIPEGYVLVEPSEIAEAQAESMKAIMNEVAPFISSFLDNKKEATRKESELAGRRLDLEEKWMDHEAKMGRWHLVIVGGSLLAIFGMAIGLIFGKDDTAAGFQLLSHVVAIAGGFIAGRGWTRMKAASHE